MPDFERAVQHICIHTGGRAVLEGLQKQLQLSDAAMAPSKAALWRYGNTSSASIWCDARARLHKLARLPAMRGVIVICDALPVGASASLMHYELPACQPCCAAGAHEAVTACQVPAFNFCGHAGTASHTLRLPGVCAKGTASGSSALAQVSVLHPQLCTCRLSGNRLHSEQEHMQVSR